VVFLIAISVGLPALSHLPHRDEVSQLLAARALVETGTLEIVPGAVPYSRGWGITYLVAGMFRLLGESLVVARLPSLVLGGLLVTVLFLWVRSEAGRVGGWFAAMLLAFSPLSLQLSTWVRFYTLYALLLLVALLFVYRLFSPPIVRLWQGIVLALSAVVILYSVEPLTGTGTIIVGLAGLGLWLTMIGLPPLFRALPSDRARAFLSAGLLALAVGATVVAFQIGFVDRLMYAASYVDLWAEGDRDNFRYYHDLLFKQNPVLWALLPLAALVAARSRPRATLLCVCIFAVAFIAHSIAASKAARYIFYALPMFFAIWGIAVASAVPWLRSRLQNRRAPRKRPFTRTAFNAIGIATLVAIVLYPAVARPALKYTLSMLTTGEAVWTGWSGSPNQPNWIAAGNEIAPMVRDADVVIASHEVMPFYALGRLDYLMRSVYTAGRGLLPEFAPTARLGVPMVSNPESLSRVMACHTTGLVFTEFGDFQRDIVGLPLLIEYLEANASKVELAEEWRIVVYRWNRSGPAAAECETLPRSLAARQKRRPES
jgi:hypothetical protein